MNSVTDVAKVLKLPSKEQSMQLLCPHLKANDDNEFFSGGVLCSPARGKGNEEGVGHHTTEIDKQQDLEPHACRHSTKEQNLC